MNQLVVGYAFEPRRNELETNDDDGDSSSDEDNELVNVLQEQNRLDNTDWCTCSHCSVEVLVSNRECICCQEIGCVKTRCNDECITLNPRFHAICLDSEALETALYGMSKAKGNSVNFQLIKPIHSR